MYAFLFPGQGAQEPGMIKDVCDAHEAARRVVDDVSAVTGCNMPALLWESDKEKLSRSDNSQLAIMTSSLAVMAVLKEKGIEPSAAMGFSLGEFPALYAAGVLSFEDTVKVVRRRGQVMQAVCEKIASENAGHVPGMSAIIGLTPDKVREICSGIKEAYPANMNSTKQTVVSGTAAALDAVETAAKKAGARRALRLSVAGPFHCPLMQEAADEFQKVIEPYTFGDPKIALFSNVTGERVKNGEEAKKSAVLHLTHSVLWTNEEDALASLMGNDDWHVAEVGVGKVLTGLWKNTAYGEAHPCLTVNSAQSIDDIER